MPSPVRNYGSENLFAQQGQVADQIEHFVPNELVPEPKRRVHDVIAGEHDRIVRGSPANQALLAHRLSFMEETEGPCRRNFTQVVAIRKIHLKALPADHPVREIDGIRNRVPVRGIDRNKLITFPQLQFLTNSQVRSRPALLANSYLEDHFYKRTRASIQNRQLEIIQLN